MIDEKSFSIIINTSCEHFEQHEIDGMIEKSPVNTLFVLQSTNYIEVDQHINCSASLNWPGRLAGCWVCVHAAFAIWTTAWARCKLAMDRK